MADRRAKTERCRSWQTVDARQTRPDDVGKIRGVDERGSGNPQLEESVVATYVVSDMTGEIGHVWK